MNKFEKYWREGKYADLWSINHTLSGVVLGSLLFHAGTSFLVSLTIALILFVGWEIIEASIDIKEHVLNMTTDVVSDLLGFLFVALFYFVFDTPFPLFVIIFFVALFLYMNFLGYQAAQRRNRT